MIFKLISSWGPKKSPAGNINIYKVQYVSLPVFVLWLDVEWVNVTDQVMMVNTGEEI